MQSSTIEQETVHDSVVVALRKVHWAETIPAYVVSFGYPLQFWWLHAAKVHQKRSRRIWLHSFVAVLTIAIGLCGSDFLLAWTGLANRTEWYLKVIVVGGVIVLTALFNILCFAIVLLFDLPSLFYTSFSAAGKESASEWLTGILGHKLWAGERTHRLLEHLLKETRVLGRAKWLLVDFLSTDIDKKIQRDPDNKSDFNGNLSDADKPDHPIYKLTVHDWTVRTYSDFLADNMSHAKRTIHWVVDPMDLVTEIIPAHVVEVIISLGSVIRGDVDRIAQVAKHALDNQPTTVNWGTLLDSYAEWCPRPHVRKGTVTCNGKHNECPDSFPFSGESRDRQLDYLWYTFFCRTLTDLKGATAIADEITMASGMKVNWKSLLSCYKKREGIVGSLVLPHIDKFRQASCSKRRHVYLGIRSSHVGDKNARIEKGVANLKSYISSGGDYIGCVSPQPAKSQTENGLFSAILSHTVDESGKVVYQQPQPDNDIWAAVHVDVKAILLKWSIDLLSYTSGGAAFLKGVFANDRPAVLDSPHCHDIGFYDGLLVLSSARDKNRDITWRVYQKAPRLEKVYFPVEPSSQVVAFPELKEILTRALN